MTQKEFDIALESIRINGEARKASLKELKMIEAQRKAECLRSLHRVQEDLNHSSKALMEYERKIQDVNRQMTEDKQKLRLLNPDITPSTHRRWEPYAFKKIAESVFNEYLATEGLDREVYITWEVEDGRPHYHVHNKPQNAYDTERKETGAS